MGRTFALLMNIDEMLCFLKNGLMLCLPVIHVCSCRQVACGIPILTLEGKDILPLWMLYGPLSGSLLGLTAWLAGREMLILSLVHSLDSPLGLMDWLLWGNADVIKHGMSLACLPSESLGWLLTCMIWLKDGDSKQQCTCW